MTAHSSDAGKRAFDDLQKLVERLARIFQETYGDIAEANNIPRERVGAATSVKIDGSSSAHSYHQKPNENALACAKELRDRLVAEFEAQGKAERDERLRKISEEIEQLREQIRAVAILAVIDLGHRAEEVRNSVGAA